MELGVRSECTIKASHRNSCNVLFLLCRTTAWPRAMKKLWRTMKINYCASTRRYLQSLFLLTFYNSNKLSLLFTFLAQPCIISNIILKCFCSRSLVIIQFPTLKLCYSFDSVVGTRWYDFDLLFVQCIAMYHILMSYRTFILLAQGIIFSYLNSK